MFLFGYGFLRVGDDAVASAGADFAEFEAYAHADFYFVGFEVNDLREHSAAAVHFEDGDDVGGFGDEVCGRGAGDGEGQDFSAGGHLDGLHFAAAACFADEARGIMNPGARGALAGVVFVSASLFAPDSGGL